MANGEVSAHVASTMRTIEELSRRFADDEDAGPLPDVLETLSQTLSELEVSSEELQAQNAELHAARQIIERERARYRDLFDQAPEPYLITDPEGVVRAANRQARTLLERRSSTLENKPLALFVSDDATADFRRVINWLRDGYGINGWELQLTTDTGEHTVLASVEPVPGEDGETELRWVLSDATSTMLARNRVNEQLERIRRDASELRVVNEWQSTLLGAAAHDLRTPLSSIDATLRTAVNHPAAADEPELSALLDEASGMVMKLRRLLPGLLDLSRLQATNVVAQRRTVDLPDLVHRVCRLLGAEEDAVELRLAVETIEADELQLERILENLLSNALHHTPDDEAIRVSSTARGVDVLLAVDDAGRGVPEGMRDRIFSPFTRITLDDRAPDNVSSGLGLTLVAMFTAMHGGRAWVEKSDLGGASFRVLLSAALPDDA